MENNRYPIEELIAHRKPMILIDKLVSWQENKAHCQVTIGSHSPFFDPTKNAVPSYVGCEYMAQSIAAFGGIQDKQQQKPVKIGFLLGTRKYQCHVANFNAGSCLDIYVEQLIVDESGLSVFNCTIMEQQTCVAEAKINVFQPADPLQFIRENQ